MLDNLIVATEREIEKLSQVVDSCPTDEVRNVISSLSSTERRPAYNIMHQEANRTIEGIKTWCIIEELFDVSERALQQRRIEFGIQPAFSEISDHQ